jgi:hypothetical protein
VGTRGFVTFVIDGAEKTTYCHADAYPEHLGAGVLRWLRSAAGDLPLLARQAGALRVVESDSAPTPDEIEALSGYCGDRSRAHEWYWLLRGTQDDPGLMLLAGVIVDAGEFPRHPQARWGYVIDLDTGHFEVYRGGHQERHERGRFAALAPIDVGGHVFYPPALAASWPLGSLPPAEGFADACYALEEAGWPPA